MIRLATILAIETATANCSVALQYGDNVIQVSQQGNNIHSQVLLDMVDKVLNQAGITVSDLDALAVGQGPGSFTGLRIGAGVAQGLAYGAKCPMLGVSSLAALTIQAVKQKKISGKVLAAIDARMNEVYWALYNIQSDNIADELELVSETQVSEPSEIKIDALNIDLSNSDISLLGNAWKAYPQEFDQDLMTKAMQFEDYIFPEAKGVLTVAQSMFARGEIIGPVDFTLEYVRNNVAVKSNKP